MDRFDMIARPLPGSERIAVFLQRLLLLPFAQCLQGMERELELFHKPNCLQSRQYASGPISLAQNPAHLCRNLCRVLLSKHSSNPANLASSGTVREGRGEEAVLITL